MREHIQGEPHDGISVAVRKNATDPTSAVLALRISARPSASAFCPTTDPCRFHDSDLPAYLANRDDPPGQLAAEVHVTTQTPPAFLIQTEDDPVRVQNRLYYYLALVNVKVPAEMHLFAKGGHGYGLRATGAPVAGWPGLAEKWFRTISVIP